MNKLKFLKSIQNQGKIKADQKDQQNSSELLNLQKEGLIKISVDLNDDGNSYRIIEYWITDKGKQYIKDHSKINRVGNIILVPFISALLAFLFWCVEQWLMH